MNNCEIEQKFKHEKDRLLQELQLVKRHTKTDNFNSKNFHTEALAYKEFLKLAPMQKRKSGWSVEYKYNKRNGQEEELVPGKSDHLSGETEFLPWFCKFNGFIKLQSANYNSSVNKKIYI